MRRGLHKPRVKLKMSGGQQGGFKAPVSSDREDTLQLPPWQDQGGRMEGSDSYRNPGVIGFRGGGVHQGLRLGGGSGYGTPNYGAGGFAGGGYGGGVLGAGQAGFGTGISGAGAGGGYGAGSEGGGYQAGGAGGLQAGGFGGPSSRIFTSPGRLVDCPTQLTLIFILWYLYFMTNIKVTNMKKYSREICYWQARLPNRNQISYNEICALWQGQPLKIGTKNINLNSKIEISSEISTIEKHEKC